MLFDRFGDRAVFFTMGPSHAGAACLALAALSVAPGAFAQAPDSDTKSAAVMSADLRGGSLLGPVKLKSATVVDAFTLSYTDKDGSQKSLEIKKGERIEGLELQGGTIRAGKASGGKLKWKTSLTLDSSTGTVTADSLEGTNLSAASLKDATISVAGQQTLKVGDAAITATLGKADGLQLKDATLENANIDKPVVPESLVQAKQLGPAATEAANITTVGDYFKFYVDVSHFRPSDADRVLGEATAPEGSCFRVSQEFDQKDPNDSSKTQKMARGKFVTGYFDTGSWGWFPRFLLPPYWCKNEKVLKADRYDIDPALSYDVPRSLILEDRDRNRFGWTYGALVAPVKYYWKAREFSGSASVGPYLGYRLHDRQGSNSVLAVAAGIATSTVTTNNADGSTSGSNTTGMTLAAAYLLEIKGTFNVGVIAGWDYFSKSQNVPTNGQIWWGLSFGYKLDE